MPEEDIYLFPLSFAQQRLWFLDQLVPGNAFYNLHTTVALKTAVSVDHLRTAINNVVDRHETLRTTFVTVDYEPRQRVVSALEIDLPVLDLSDLEPEARATESIRIAQEEAVAPFDLTAGPLIRAKVVRLAPADNLLMITLHHIVCDGWSLGVLWRDLNEHYTACLLNRTPVLPELPIQYTDFAVWQREWLQGPRKDEELAYWKGKLADLRPLDMPTDRPRPPIASYRGAQATLSLPGHLCSGLRRLGQRIGTTLFMTLLSGFQILLSRYSHQDDVVVGVPTAGRTQGELEPLIGFFVNTLVMRGDLAGDPSAEIVIQRTRQMATEAYGNQDLPFEHLVEALQPERDLSRNPLYQVTFQLLSGGAGRDGSGQAAPSNAERGAAVFDLSVNLWETPTEIVGSIEYSAELFDAVTIERMAEHYVNLLKSMVANPSTSISRLNILGAHERRRLLVEWNETDAPLPDAALLHRLVEARVDATPDALAIVDDRHRLTYAELDEAANRLARGLLDEGLVPGQPVALAFDRCVDLIVAMLAVLKAGGAYVPLDMCHPHERVRLLVEQLVEPLVLCEQRHLDGLHGVEAPVLEAQSIAARAGRGERPQLPLQPDDLAYIMFTSGSTGVPKGVEIAHRGIVNLSLWHQRAFQVGAGDRASQFAGPAFDACGWEVWPYLISGAAVCITPNDVRATPRELMDWMAAQRIDIAFLPTPVAELVLKESMPESLRLRTLLTGGDKLRFRPRPDVPFTVYNNYGPTEYTVVTTSVAVEPLDPERDEPLDARPPSIGRPIANTRIFVLDEHRQPVPIGISGELYVGGAGLAVGYHDQPELTAESFVALTLPVDGAERLYRSGDVVRYRADGSLEFIGRADDQVKIRGHRVELGEIEATLIRSPDVDDAIAIFESQPDGAATLTAYLVPAQPGLTQGADATKFIETMRGFARRTLPDVQVPTAFVPIEAIALTANGKVDRASLARHLAPRPGGRARVAPRSDLERAMSEVFAQVLGCEEVDVFDNFFSELGGHSLLATQLVSRINQMFDIDTPLQSLFENPTVASLCAVVEETLIAEIEALSEEEVERLAAGE